MKDNFDRTKNFGVQFPSGSFVMVSNATRKNKWKPQWEGPYIVIRRNMGGSYRLKCPATEEVIGAPIPPERLKAVKLEPDDHGVFVIDHIVKSRKNSQGQEQYLVRWKGFGSSEDTWEDKKAFNDPETITEYWRKKSVISTRRSTSWQNLKNNRRRL